MYSNLTNVYRLLRHVASSDVAGSLPTSAGIVAKAKYQDDEIAAAVNEMKFLTVVIYSKVKRLGFHTVPPHPNIVEVDLVA